MLPEELARRLQANTGGRQQCPLPTGEWGDQAGVPEEQAGCMAPRMAERLTRDQLRKLQNVAPQEGEAALPRDAGEALARIRRVDDPEAVEVTVRAAAACAFGGIFENL